MEDIVYLGRLIDANDHGEVIEKWGGQSGWVEIIDFSCSIGLFFENHTLDDIKDVFRIRKDSDSNYDYIYLKKLILDFEDGKQIQYNRYYCEDDLNKHTWISVDKLYSRLSDFFKQKSGHSIRKAFRIKNN